MRVYHTRPLLRVVEGTEDTLVIRGRLGAEITPAIEAWLKELPGDMIKMFNRFSTPEETLDYASEPIVYMPDEFTFHFDVESLGRLAREFLISGLPGDASIWQSKHVPIADFWLGGQDELLTKDERARLEEAMRQVWAMPIRGKIFVVDMASLYDHAVQLGTPDAIREAGGILHREVSPACDYYVTNRPEAAEAAQRAGAKEIINTLTLSVMFNRG